MMKYKSIFLNKIIILSLLVMMIPLLPQSSLDLKVKEAQAETACPAPIPSSQITLRTGSATGPILAQYTNDGSGYDSDGNPVGIDVTSADISVPAGTVIYYNSSTSGVQSVNRSPGSSQRFTGAVTVTSPSDLVGYYPSGYFFSKRSFASGRTNPITGTVSIFVSGHNSCWGGGEDGQTATYVQISSAGAPTPPTTKTTTASLAVLKNPTVSLLINGSTNANLPSGSTANFTWTTNSVNIGDSCVASNDNVGKTGPDSTWNGAKLGQASYPAGQTPPASGGSQTVGPFSKDGTYNYTIFCYGLNNLASAVTSVQVIVGPVPTYTCSANPGTQQVFVGSNGGASIQVLPVNGYASPVTFTSAISPSTGTPPTISFSNNPQSSPYSVQTSATIATSASTTVGVYQITFTGTGGVTCPPITFTVNQLNPSGSIACNGQQDSCNIAYGAAATISWSSLNVTSCTVYNPAPTVWASGNSGSKSSGALTGTVTYDLYCTGPYGDVIDSVIVNVPSAPPNAPTISANNSTCGQVTVSWTPGATPPPITGYRVYNGSSSTGPWTLVSNSNPNPDPLPSSQTSFIHYGGSTSNNYYMVRAFNGSTQSADSNAVLSNSTSCAGNLSRSDKELVSVTGRINKNFTPKNCSGSSEYATLPNNAVFAVNDIITFRINVCNSGNSAVQNIAVTDTMEKLSNPTNFTSEPAGCLTGSTINANGSITFNLDDIQAPPLGSTTEVCSIIFKAKVTAPANPSAAIYRFSNTASITADNDLNALLRTGTYLFSIAGGVPDRTETAPQ
jgi:uncharacterized repeat protein (TIGR01451 family)